MADTGEPGEGWGSSGHWLAVPVETQHAKRLRLRQGPVEPSAQCPGCYKITTVFSHAQTVVLCVGCSTVLCQPTGGKARLTEGCSFRRKQH
ncbi:40S ribosomal protein S27 [Puma concolor]|uniref:40S ribosomal protein S27 n=1 Tax=Puma concolor TaxID=9696 RepID=A0A6P6H6E9_PUMCO|nr:40S ribosomal protein S27 [Puma concolor]